MRTPDIVQDIDETTTDQATGADAPVEPAAGEPAAPSEAPMPDPEDLPTSGELDAAPVEEALSEATEATAEPAEPAIDEAEAADTPAVDEPAEPAIDEAEAADTPAVDEPEAAVEAEADGESDDLDDLLGIAGAETDEAATPEPAGDEAEEAPAAAAEEPAEEAPKRKRRPRRLEDVEDQKDLARLFGDWYVVHTYSGYEQRVKDNLTSRIEALGADDRIFEIVIPTQEVTEFKKGKKQTVAKKFLPGYVLVRMFMDDEVWGLVRHTPAVTGFVGATGTKPVPLSLKEVADILSIPEEVIVEVEGEEVEEAASKDEVDIDLEVGETIRVTSGPFADFTGTIAEINVDQAKLKVLVSVFGRETPLELPFDNIAKL